MAESCLDELAEPYRAVIRLRDVEGLSAEDVAERLAVGVDLLTARLDRARRLLAQAVCRRCRTAPVTS